MAPAQPHRAREIENLGGWLTTVVARICLDLLRAVVPPRGPSRATSPSLVPEAGVDPEHEALLADSVGLALLVVLETLTPPNGSRSSCTTCSPSPSTRSPPSSTALLPRHASSRAGPAAGCRASPVPDPDIAQQRQVVDAFLAAARDGDFEALLAVLHPDIVLRADRGAFPRGASRDLRGAQAVAERVGRLAALAASAHPARQRRPRFIVVPAGRPVSVAGFTVSGGLIVEIDMLVDPERLREIDLTIL